MVREDSRIDSFNQSQIARGQTTQWRPLERRTYRTTDLGSKGWGSKNADELIRMHYNHFLSILTFLIVKWIVSDQTNTPHKTFSAGNNWENKYKLSWKMTQALSLYEGSGSCLVKRRFIWNKLALIFRSPSLVWTWTMDQYHLWWHEKENGFKVQQQDQKVEPEQE